MTPAEFVKQYHSEALRSQNKTGISAVAILAQAAVESGWGKFAPGFMFFGVKDTDGVNGNEQLLTTTEYHDTAVHKYPQILGITAVVINGRRRFKYKIKDWFRKYKSAEECFTDHCNFLLQNKRYSKALQYKSDPFRFIDELAAAGYATDPNYAKTLKSVAKTIQSLI